MKQRQINLKTGLWAAVVLLALTLVSGRVFIRAAADATPPSAPMREVERLRADLQREGLSAQAQDAIAEKLALAEQLVVVQPTPDAAALDAKLNAAPPASPVQQLTLEEQFPEQIFGGSQGLLRPSLIEVVNGWQGVRNNTVLQIFAGSLPEDPQAGLVVVLRLDPDALTRTFSVYPAPAGGALEIEAVQDQQLLLRDANADAWLFDWTTGTYSRP